MKRFGLIGASFVLVSSIVGCSNNEEIKITDALSAIKQLSNLNDFTLDIYNTSLGDKGFIYFTKDYYYDVLNSYGYIKGNKGVYQFDVDHTGTFVSNEIKTQFNGQLYKNGIIPSFNDFDLNTITYNGDILEIKNKDNRIAFLNLIGEDYSKYTSINNLTAKYDEKNGLTFNLVFNDESYINVSVIDINSTHCKDLEKFIKSAKPFVPEENIKNVRDLIYQNNFTRYIYDSKDSTTIIGKEYFVEDYYCISYFTTEYAINNTGFISLVNKSYQGKKIDNGSYLVTPGFGEDASVNVFLGHYAFVETDMPSIMNYPSNLEMFKYLNLFSFSDQLECMFTQDSIITTDVYNNFGVANAGFESVALTGVGYDVEKTDKDYVLTIRLFGTFDGAFGQMTFELREFGYSAHLGVEKFKEMLE